jgi:hypothetical protein
MKAARFFPDPWRGGLSYSSEGLSSGETETRVRNTVLVLISSVTAAATATKQCVDLTSAEDAVTKTTTEVILRKRGNCQENDGYYG